MQNQESDALASLLASGDVDAIRQLLRQGNHAEPDERPAASAAEAAPAAASVLAASASAAATGLFADRPLLRVTINGIELQLRSYRTMGKVLWPAGHAVALQLASLGPSSALSSVGLIEIGAGAAVPSLVAATTGGFNAVLATDAFEENVALIRHNAALNGRRLEAIVRLDVGDRSMLTRIVEAHIPALNDLLLVACDMSYDPDAIAHIFSSMVELISRRPACRPLLLFARSDNFAHMDALTEQTAARHGFALLAHTVQRAPGVLDCISERHLTPCAEDAVESFYFAPAEAAETAADEAGTVAAASQLSDEEEATLKIGAAAATLAAAAGHSTLAAAAVEAAGAGAATKLPSLTVDPAYRAHPAALALLDGAGTDAQQQQQQQQQPMAVDDDMWAPTVS